jgi:transposase
MTKYSFKDKLEILLGYKEEKTSQSEYPKKSVIKAQFQYWLRLYELHGEDDLQLTYTNYTKKLRDGPSASLKRENSPTSLK